MKFPRFSDIYRLGLRYPYLVLALGALFTLLSFFWVKNLRIDTDFNSLLPPKTKSVQDLLEMKKYFGGLDSLYLTVEAQTKALGLPFESLKERRDRLEGK